MAFRLYEDPEDTFIDYEDKASYNFNQHGFLVVVTETGKRITFAPHAWHHIEDHPSRPPGFFA